VDSSATEFKIRQLAESVGLDIDAAGAGAGVEDETDDQDD
jgi:hypothetical protein